jgi:hypothetical protein
MSTLPAAIATIPSATRIPVAQLSQMSCLVRMMPPVAFARDTGVRLTQTPDVQMIIILI